MKRILLSVLFFCLPVWSYAEGNIPDLSGKWMEVQDIPNPEHGIVEVIQKGNKIEGRYLKVSPFLEKYFGFKVGELVLTGTVDGDKMTGNLLIKPRMDQKKNCPQIPASKWAPVAFEINAGSDVLSGDWENQEIDFTKCTLGRTMKEAYTMKKIP